MAELVVDYDLLVIKSDVDSKMFHDVRSKTDDDRAAVLYVILDTVGGSPMDAFRTMKVLDVRYDEIYVIVLDKAMSAGTLMALGSDKIFLGDGACLGPLDLQILHPKDESWISTLDIRDAVTSIASQVSVVAQHFMQEHVNIGLSRIKAAELGYREAVNLMSPIVAQIDPFHYGRSFRISDLGSAYANELLSSRMLKDNKGLARYVGNYLTSCYGSHDYAIMYDELKDVLKLEVEPLSSLPFDVFSNVDSVREICESQLGRIIELFKINKKEEKGA